MALFYQFPTTGLLLAGLTWELVTLCRSGGEQIKGGNPALGKHLGRGGTGYLSGRLSHWAHWCLGPAIRLLIESSNMKKEVMLVHAHTHAGAHTHRAVWATTSRAQMMHLPFCQR